MKKHRMKMAMLTLVLSLAAALPTHADVAFNEANFPDANFRSWLSSHFAAAVADGVWTDAELATVTKIACSFSNIESMVGIEHFSNLQEFYSNGNKFTQLDLSKNHLLAKLDVEGSNLHALNVANTALTFLNCMRNQLASLNCEGLDDLKNTSTILQEIVLDKVYKMDYNGKTYYFVWLEEEHKNLDQSLAEQMKAYEGEMGEDYVHFNPEHAEWNHNCEVFEGTPVAGGLSDGLDANAFPGKVLLLNPETKSFTYTYDATPSRERKKKIPMPVTVTWENAEYTTAIGGIPFDEEHFPDQYFRANLARNLVDETADNWLTPEELTGEQAKDFILTFFRSEGDMESLEGIQYFTELDGVDFNHSGVKSADFSQNTKLTTIDAEGNHLMSLDLSNNTLLEGATLRSQRVSNWPVNMITVNGKDYYYTALADFAAKVKAYEGDISVPFSLDRVTWGANCEVFNGTPVAGGLSEGLSAGTFNGPVLLLDPENPSFTYVYDVHNAAAGQMDVRVSWVLGIVTDGIPFDEEHFPDANFRRYLAARFPEATADLFWTYDELATVTELYCYNSNIESLVGVEYFNNLVTLHCYYNNIAQLDLSKNHLLANLNVEGSNLHALNVVNTALTDLNCQRNQLTSLDCTGMDDLKNTTTILQQIVFEKVNKMDYNGKTYYYLWLDEEHKGNEKSLTDLVNAHEGEMGEDYVPFSVDRARMYSGSDFEVFEGTPVEGKLSEGLDANAFAGKVLLLNPETKRFTYAYDATPDRDRRKILMDEIITWVDAEYAPEPLDGIPFDEEHFPDANFRSALAKAFPDETADLFWTYAELATVTDIDCGAKSIASMKGIEYFTALTRLHCESNLLGQDDEPLDLSKNIALTALIGWNNYDLKQIILPATESLTSIHVSECALTSLDVTKNPNLESLKCTNNELTWLDLTQNTKLRILACGGNHLTSLDLSNNQLLTAYNIDNQTVNLGECSGSVKRDGTDKKYFFGLKESYKDDIVKSLPKLINDWEAQHTETFVNFNLNRVDWVDGCYYVGSNGHGAPRRAQLEWTPEYPILILTDEPNENEFTYDYRVNIPNDQEKKMTVKATYQKPKDDDLLIDTSTAIDTVTADADVVSVRYINVSGVSSNEPWDGVNIVVTTKADGTQSVTKVLR